MTDNGGQPRAYSYVRFSTPEQEKGDSLRRQVQQSEAYALEHGLTLDDSLRLTDRVSAFRGVHKTRGALGQFLKLIEQGEIPTGSLLIVENLDRLSREQVLDALGQFTSIIRSGVKVITLQDGMEYSEQSVNANFGQLLMSIVYMSRAHEESQGKSLRLKAAWEGKREQVRGGEHKLTAKGPAWLKLPPLPEGVRLRSEVKCEFEVIPERAETVQQIFQMKLAGKGAARIAAELNESGCWRPKRGWRKSYINKILRTRATIGEFTPCRKVDGKRVPEDPLPDYYPAIVDKGVFDRVQVLIRANLQTRGFAGGRNGKVGNLFGYLATCRACGAPMTFLNKGDRSYLQCDAYRRKLGCTHGKPIPYNELESAVLLYCKGLEAADVLPGDERRQSELSVLQNQLMAVEGGLLQVQGQIDNLTDSIASTDSEQVRKTLEDKVDHTLTQKTELEDQGRELRDQIEGLSRQGHDTERQLSSIRELIEHMGKLKGQEFVDLRLNLRGRLRQLLDRVLVDVGPERRSCLLLFKSGERRLLHLLADGWGKGMDAYPKRGKLKQQ